MRRDIENWRDSIEKSTELNENHIIYYYYTLAIYNRITPVAVQLQYNIFIDIYTVYHNVMYLVGTYCTVYIL